MIEMEWAAGGIMAALFLLALIAIIRQDIRDERRGVTRDERPASWTRSKW